MGEQFITIQKPTSPEAFYDLERVQGEIFGFNDTQVIPASFLLASVKNGGLVVQAALERVGTVVGFLYSFAAFAPENLIKHHTYLLGVHPAYRNQGVGYQLMLAHREATLAQGNELISWTLDPLDAPSANLSFRKMGANATQLSMNRSPAGFCGPLSSPAQDSLEVTWWLRSSRVADRLGSGPAKTSPTLLPRPDQQVSRVELSPKGLKLVDLDLSRTDLELFLAIPKDFQRLVGQDAILAGDWRTGVRDALKHYLANGYELVDFISGSPADEFLNWFLLRRVGQEK